MNCPTKPIVLTIAGHDPSGGAGLTADVMTIEALGCQALSVMTCSTVQNSTGLKAIHSMTPEWVIKQLTTLQADFNIQAIKLGALGCATTCLMLHEKLSTLTIPVICDPVLQAGAGGQLADQALIRAYQTIQEWPSLWVPNNSEFKTLFGTAAATSTHPNHVLITDGHKNHEHATAMLYQAGQLLHAWPHRRLPGEYRGTGCRFSSAIASLLALNHPLEQAVPMAIEYMQNCLAHATTAGQGQPIPSGFHRSCH